MRHRYILLFALLIGFAACEEFTPVPKPRAYPKVTYPAGPNKTLKAPYCDFSFEQPDYVKMTQDSFFFDEKAKSDCWFNLDVPELNATIHCSYFPVRTKADFDKHVTDAFEMVNKHNVKANYIAESNYARPEDNVYGIVYTIEGPAASPYQFFLTDSTNHFLRGSLYFRTESRPDSMAPVIAFMKKDVNQIIETLKWEK